MKDKIIIGIDGGASKTSGVLFNDKGKTICHAITLGTNLSIDEMISAKRVINLINTLLKKAQVEAKDVSAIGIGLAGASNENGRDILFGLLDNLGLSEKAILTNDIDSVYDFIWSNQKGILLNVGTGVICTAKKDGKFIRVAGKGHNNGDIGSGYWIGKEILIEVGLKNSASYESNHEILPYLLKRHQAKDYDDLIVKIDKNDERIPMIASFAEDVIQLAKSGNELARDIVQQATRMIAEYIVEVRDVMEYGDNDIILAGNGSVLRNDYFRKELNNALSFDFNQIKWIFLDISPAYAPGVLSARLKSIKINRKSLNVNPLKIEE